LSGSALIKSFIEIPAIVRFRRVIGSITDWPLRNDLAPFELTKQLTRGKFSTLELWRHPQKQQQIVVKSDQIRVEDKTSRG
jgi:hypothetical protein